MERGSQVLVMSEHWLWHFELGRLEQISGEYEATGKADGRLTEGHVEVSLKWGFEPRVTLGGTLNEQNLE